MLPTPKRYWTPEEEANLIRNYIELGGNATEIAKRHDRTPRAIDMRLTKLVKDRKRDAQDVAALFKGKMSLGEIQDRWNSPEDANANKKTGDGNDTLLKYLTEIDDKLDDLKRRIMKIEKKVIRICKSNRDT